MQPLSLLPPHGCILFVSAASEHLYFHCPATRGHLLLPLFKKSLLGIAVFAHVTVWVDSVLRRWGLYRRKDVPFHTSGFHLWGLGLDVNFGPVQSHTSQWWCRQMRKFDVSSESPNQRRPQATRRPPNFLGQVPVSGWKWGRNRSCQSCLKWKINVNKTHCRKSRFRVACKRYQVLTNASLWSGEGAGQRVSCQNAAATLGRTLASR